MNNKFNVFHFILNHNIFLRKNLKGETIAIIKNN